jgi:dephospho-CoA kinase
MEKKKFLVGLMGGIGSGKSKVCSFLQELGAQTISADTLVHKALKSPSIQQQITSLWGNDLLVNDEIDRKKLAALVFSFDGARDNLKKLESILHPAVRKEIENFLQQQQGKKMAVIDAPLLWEGGLYKRCDCLIFVDTPLAIRQQRVNEQRNWTCEEIEKREKFQQNLEVKKQACHFILDNSGDWEQTKEQVMKIWKNLETEQKIY